MERRLLIVFALTFLVIAISQPLLKKYFPQSVDPAPGPNFRRTLRSRWLLRRVLPRRQMAATTAVSVAAKQASAEAELVVENDFYRISFTNRGGQVKSWVLKKFDDDRGQPLDLVNGAAAAKYGYPLSLWTYDEGMRNKLNSALYVSSQSGNLKTPAEVTFEYADQDINVRKRFRFDQSYVVQVETSATQKGNSISALPVWPAGIGDQPVRLPTIPARSSTNSTAISSGSPLRRSAAAIRCWGRSTGRA